MDCNQTAEMPGPLDHLYSDSRWLGCWQASLRRRETIPKIWWLHISRGPAANPESLAMKQPISFGTRSRTTLPLGLILVCLLPSSLRGQGSVESWGADNYGKFSGTPSGTDFTQVSGGTWCSSALRADGSIASWGRDLWGQISGTPNGTGFTQISVGGGHSHALRPDGSIASWGRDDWNQITDAPTGTGFVQVWAGGTHSLALRGDGLIVAWGRDNAGQVSGAPGGTGYTQVAAGNAHSLAIRADTSIAAWGADIGPNGIPGGQVSQTPPGVGFTRIDGGAFHSLALDVNGIVRAWGVDTDPFNNPSGQVSNSPGGGGFTQVSAGEYHSLALRDDGTIYSWGYDLDPGGVPAGQVSDTPDGCGFVQISAGGYHSLAIHVDNSGNAYCLGDGSGTLCPCLNGQIGQGCANSGGSGATLTASGDACFTEDTFQLSVSGIPGAKAGLLVKGSFLIGGGNGNVVGDGLLCLAPQMRSQVIVSDPSGTLTMSNWRGQPFGTFPNAADFGTPTYYQWWYRDPAPYCPSFGFNFTNGWAVTWMP